MTVAAWRAPVRLLAMLIVAALVPLGWRVALHAWGPPADRWPRSYLPALEPARERQPFVADPIGDLQRMAPDTVIIGDSMAGRVDFDRLTALSHGPVAPILQNATGSAYWYLVFKNYVVASGIKPKRVLIFFRDTNLTDPMFRLDGPYRATLDEVARDREDELNRVVAARVHGPWYAAHAASDDLYDTARAREWIVPAFGAWAARVVAGPAGADEALARINAAFGLDKLRTMPQADLDAASDADTDFRANVGTSVLPLLLSLAAEHHLPLVFVRVLRRPDRGAPPHESPALRRYVADLGAYLDAHGAALLDDRDDPVLATLPYADGDHVAREARLPYTDRLWPKLQAIEQR